MRGPKATDVELQGVGHTKHPLSTKLSVFFLLGASKPQTLNI